VFSSRVKEHLGWHGSNISGLDVVSLM